MTAGFLSARGVPVCGHWAGQETPLGAGLVASLGDSGAKFLVLEGMESASVQQLLSAQPQLLTLGLQAGLQTAGQLVSVHTLLGVHGWRDTAAGKSYLSRHGSIQLAMAAYVADVKANRFAQDAVCHG